MQKICVVLQEKQIRASTPPVFVAAASVAAPSGIAMPAAVAVRGPTAAGLAAPAFAVVAALDPIDRLVSAAAQYCI